MMSIAEQNVISAAVYAVSEFCPNVNMPSCLNGVENIEIPFSLLKNLCAKRQVYSYIYFEKYLKRVLC